MKYSIIELIINNDTLAFGIKNRLKYFEILNWHPCIIDNNYNIWTLSHNVNNYRMKFLALEWLVEPIEISKRDIEGRARVQSIVKPGMEFVDLLDLDAMHKRKKENKYQRMLEYYKEYHKIIDSIVDESKGNKSILKISSEIRRIKYK